MTEPDERIANGYDTFYRAWGTSPTLRRLWRDKVTGRVSHFTHSYRRYRADSASSRLID